MSVIRVDGPITWTMTQDDQSHREYKAVWLVETNDSRDGPATVLSAPGLPVVGSPWRIGNDVDLWAWCRFIADVKPVQTGDATIQWYVTLTFSTKPQDPQKARCIDSKFENPLSEPPVISGSTHKFTREAMHDIYGAPILSSSWEMLRGKENEWDEGYPTIKIVQNVASSYQALTLPNAMMNSLNALPLWGLASRCIKLSNFSFERKFYGTCFPYFARTLEFEANYETWDRNLLDMGSAVLRGHTEQRPLGGTYWILDKVKGIGPDPFNASDFVAYKDSKGDKHHAGVVLNGRGLPAGAWIKANDPNAGYSGYVRIGVAPLKGKKLTERRYWILQPDNTRVVQEQLWNTETEYEPGDVVFDRFGKYHIALRWNASEDPADGSLVWDFLDDQPTDVGAWNVNTVYNRADRVRAAPNGDWLITPGFRFVQKYPSANFLILGIPLTF